MKYSNEAAFEPVFDRCDGVPTLTPIFRSSRHPLPRRQALASVERVESRQAIDGGRASSLIALHRCQPCLSLTASNSSSIAFETLIVKMPALASARHRS